MTACSAIHNRQTVQPPPPLLLLPLASDSVLEVHSIILKYLSTPTAGVVFIAAAAALYNNICGGWKIAISH